MEEEKFVWIYSEGIGNGNEKKGMVDCANGIRKGPWTYEEDMQLVSYINFYGEGRWAALAKNSGLKRTGKSCRMRWVNYLRPDLKRGRITQEEECLIIDLHRRLGNRWSRIAQSLPGRTDNEIKNYFRSHIRKKLRTTYDQGSCNHKANGGERLKSGGCILQEAEEAAAARSIIDIDGNLTPSSSSSSSSFKQSPKTQDGSEMLGITNMNKKHNKNNNNKGKRLISYGFAWMSCIADSVYDCFEQGFHCGKALSMDTTSVDCCESAAAAAAQGDSHCETFIDYSDELWNMNYKDRLYLHS